MPHGNFVLEKHELTNHLKWTLPVLVEPQTRHSHTHTVVAGQKTKMVKLLGTSGVIEKTHVVLSAEHGPNKRTVSVSCTRVSFHVVVFSVHELGAGKPRQRCVRRVTTAAADNTRRESHRDELLYVQQTKGRHSKIAAVHFGRILILLFLFCVRFV